MKIGQGDRLVWKNNRVRVELISIKIHGAADYPSATHAGCGFTDQASRIAGVIRINKRVKHYEIQKIQHFVWKTSSSKTRKKNN